MYANGANNRTVSTANSLFENTITVTPIKLEVTGGVTPSHGVLNSVTSSTAGGNVRRSTNVISTTPTNTTVSMPFANQATIVSTTANNNTNNVSSHANTTLGNTGALAKEKPVKTTRTQIARKPPPTLDNFWPNITNDVNSIQHVDAKHQVLPLARIKKIMKLDENAKMIAAEAPLLFAKACEYFIQELTMRAWIHTEESKRRTLQRSDIAQAIANYDQFDFLIDIVPREDIKPTSGHKKESTVTNSTSTSANTGNSAGATAATVSTLSNPAMHVGTNTAGAVKLEGTTEILSFGTPNTDMFASQTQHLHQMTTQQQQQTQPHQQLQIIQQSAGHPGAQQLQYFIALPGQQPGQAQIVQQLQQQHHQQQQQQQQHHQQTQHTQIHNGLGLNIVSQPQQQTQQLILTAGPNGQLTATPAPTTATTAQQQTQTLLQNLAVQQQQQHQQQQQQQVQQQQIQLLQQVVGPNGELTNVPITINANQLNLLRLQMQQQQQQQQQQQVIMPTQLLTHPQLLHQLSGHAATAIATTTTTSGQQQQQQTHTLTNTVNNVANTNNGANIFLNATSASAQASQTHQLNGSGSGNGNGNNNNTNSNNTTIVTTERNLANTYRQNC